MTLSLILIGLLQVAVSDEAEPACGASPQAQALALLIIGHERQQREELYCNEILVEAAAQRAMDLVENPDADERSANEIVQKAGFRFPMFYPRVGNQVQAIAEEVDSPEAAIEYLARSFEHRDLILGDDEFFSRQSEMGVGYYPDEHGQGKYVVFIAEPYSKPKIVIKQEFKAPRMITAEECGRTWRSSRNAEFRNKCRELWLEKKDKDP